MPLLRRALTSFQCYEFNKICNELANKSGNGKQQRKPQWRSDKQSEFLSNIDQDKLSALKNVVNNMCENLNSINLEQINSMCMEIGQYSQMLL